MERWEHWLRQRPEIPLDPSRAIVDPHHHLWDRGGHTYLGEQFRSDIADNRVVDTVYVECRSNYRTDGPPELLPVGETEFVCRLGAIAHGTTEVARGIVGYADLTLGARVVEVLDAHEAVARRRFKGIRFSTAWDADTTIHGSYPTRAGMLTEPLVREGATELGRRGLSLDVWLYFHQLKDAVSLARACPTLSLVIDHCGGPLGVGAHAGRRPQVFDEWRKSLQDFRALSHVAMKFGGLAMPLAGFAWKSRDMPPSSEELADAWRPYFEVCLDVFGSDRCMFESNFPVDRSGCSYTTLWNGFKRLSEQLSADERDALFERTARRVYRL